jgi:predicted MFS family arabinose efflux permease
VFVRNAARSEANAASSVRQTALSLFVGLGAQVGAFAVLVPDLAASRALTPAALGAALAVMSAASILTLFAAGAVADRTGRRPLLVAGAGGFAAAFGLLAGVEAPVALWPTLALYGVASGCLDLGANTVGADYERAYGVRAMVRLHAGFSAAAAVCALVAAGVAAAAGHRVAYGAMAGAYVLLVAWVARAALPPHVAEGEEPPPPGGRLALLRVPGIALATGICTLCFFGDGAIEGFSALLLRGAQDAGTLGAGASLAAFHAASLGGRLAFARIGDARGDAWVLTAAGLGAAAAMTVLVTAGSPVLGGVALLCVGFALAPVIPTVLSLAARSAPGRSAAAVSVVTTLGYSAFVLGPPVVGAVAGFTSLRVALGLSVATMLAFAALARLGRRAIAPPAGQTMG